MEFQQGFKALFLCCTLHSCVQAQRNRRDHGPQCLDQQHRHHLVRVLEYLFVKVQTKSSNYCKSFNTVCVSHNSRRSTSHLAGPLELTVPRGEQGVIEFRQLLIQTEITLRKILPNAHQLPLEVHTHTFWADLFYNGTSNVASRHFMTITDAIKTKENSIKWNLPCDTCNSRQGAAAFCQSL